MKEKQLYFPPRLSQVGQMKLSRVLCASVSSQATNINDVDYLDSEITF